MPSIHDVLPEDPLEAEKILIRVVTDAYRLTPAWKDLIPAWKDHQEVVVAIEEDIRNVSEPSALGLSPEFEKWESLATAAGVIWEVDDEGFIRVSY